MNIKWNIRKLAEIFFWGYLIILFRITVFRNGFTFHNFFQNGSVNLAFMTEYLLLLQKGAWNRFIYLLGGNIVWFMPFGFYLRYRGKISRTWIVVIFGFLFSLIIESLQYVFGTGISEVDDLFLNTLGTWIGAAGANLLLSKNKE